MSYDKRRAMVASVLDALAREMHGRADHNDWVERERLAVVTEVNRLATAYGWRTITVEDVERIEGRAMGHVDYASKLALYASELTWS